ncbi:MULTISPECIES: Stk1 family PASTA domain-containing Ser/Thr kinase [Paenibacillus]|uniref:Stk1 family PASTA domain-containing Ser/Thr kinase n=1 Tax=Paenibacillus TaxID=44249 RepID=UPI0022B8FFDC|nr:Stk1 family PASTA domain-containing Ser/Thr kinase [Paenibacillus caseinilyticus]MCZ8521810.1 PASTA domain-containing protein [Paenibacillus caseinilyticus]
MEKPESFRSRYVLGQPILPMISGMLYGGKDLSLHREVLLYVVDSADDSLRQAAMARLQEVAPLSDNRFLHMLDVGMEKPYLFAVLKTFDGRPLIESLPGHGLTDREILSGVFELGRGLQDAMEEGVSGYAVDAANVWLCDDGRLKIINYWDKGQDSKKGAQGLARLLLQLLTRKEEPELGPPGERALRASLSSLNAVQQAELIAMLRRTAVRQETLSSLVVHLGLLVKSPEALSSRASLHETPVYETVEAVRAELGRREAPPRHVPPPSSAPAAFPPEPDEEEEEAPAPKRAWKTGLKLLLGAALVLTAGTAVFVWLVNEAPSLPGMPGKQESAAPAPDTGAAVPSAPPATSVPAGPDKGSGKAPEKPAEPPDKSSEGEGAALEGGSVETPNLIGLQQADAEAKADKIAKETGLGYAFYRKPSEEPAGTVFDQTPKPGEAAPRGTKVIFYISRGP